ncbi:MAG: threonine--tRNA ligase [Anaerolineales bacterium]|jgi:threonyl-tRNA synthetase
MAEKIEEKYEDSELYKIRHSTAHIMAQAVMEMFEPGEAKISIGPPIENGFYYDFELPRQLSPEDFEAIEKRMRQIITEKHPFEKKVVSAKEAKKAFKDQPFKIELIEGLEDGGVDEYGEPINESPEISFYTQDSFTDLCRGPHVENTGDINPSAFKLMSVAGAYWRGDENKPQLQRIYGTAWKTAGELKEHLWRLEEAKRRDHRKLGKELDLFSVEPDKIGSGLILWHPKGGLMRHIVEEFYRREHLNNGYDLVITPHIGHAELWQTSGHLDFYQESMYSPLTIDGQDYYLKPMNCPFHILIYQNKQHSYRDLPIRYAEWGTVYRYERSGTLHGLMRVRGFTQDDAHHFVSIENLADEIDFTLNFSLHILRSFGFKEINAYLSTQPADKFVGDPQDWRKAEDALEASLKRAELPYKVDEGGGAFYGPKIDLKVKDSLEREWQLSTIQVDFNLPERFDMTYTGEDGNEHRPFMIHRALLGSLERFYGILIEYYGGAFPLWIAPVQMVMIPIADRHNAYAQEVADKLIEKGFRVEVDDSSERMNNKIRLHTQQKVPYMLVVGDKEMEAKKVAPRTRDGEDLGPMSVGEFVKRAEKENEAKI